MKRLITVLLMFASLSVFSQNIWLIEKVEIKIDDKFKFGMEYEDRFSDFHIKYEHTDINLSYSLIKNLSMSIALRSVREFDSTAISQEYRPHLSIEYKYHKFEIRPRFEVRFIDDEHSFRFRNKISFVQPLYKKLNLYLADEVFITDKIEGNRIYCGLVLKYKVVDFLFYYLLSSKNRETWLNENVSGINISLKL